MTVPKTLRYVYFRCVRLHGKPREVAMGMAIGLAVGLSPTMGLQMLLAVPIAAVFGQSKLAAAAGVWISNPLTAPFIYGITYSVGAIFLGYPLLPPTGWVDTFTSWERITHSLVTPLWVGGGLVSIPVCLGGYFLTYQSILAYRLKVKHRRANKLHKWRWNPHDGWHRVSVKPKRSRRAVG